MLAQPWYLSKGIWGAVLTVASLALTWFGYDGLDEETRNAILDNIVILTGSIATLISAVLAFIGRIKATTSITTTASKAATINASVPK